MAKILPYDPKLKQLANKLRKTMTYGEVMLWNCLKGNKMLGFDFDRQRCIDKYIVDFYCRDLMLAIEIDGNSHSGVEAFEKDQLREKRLTELGVFVVRFTEAAVKYDMQNVLRALENEMLRIIKSDGNVKLPHGFDRSLLIG